MTMKKNGAVSASEAEVSKKTEEGENYFASVDLGKMELTLETLLKNGVHFGHQKARRNPKMDKYIFTTRKGINIIDLQKTAEKLQEAMDFLAEIKASGKKVLFVGTKTQARELARDAAEFSDMFFVSERWLGGTFTNFKIIRQRARYLVDSQDKFAKGEFKKYTKFEQMKKIEELEKMEKRMGGIKNMIELPAAIFAMSIKEDNLAIKEAQKVGVPVVAIADTNVDPTGIDFVIPANDDAVSSLRTIMSYVCKAIVKE